MNKEAKVFNSIFLGISLSNFSLPCIFGSPKYLCYYDVPQFMNLPKYLVNSLKKKKSGTKCRKSWLHILFIIMCARSQPGGPSYRCQPVQSECEVLNLCTKFQFNGHNCRALKS